MSSGFNKIHNTAKVLTQDNARTCTNAMAKLAAPLLLSLIVGVAVLQIPVASCFVISTRTDSTTRKGRHVRFSVEQHSAVDLSMTVKNDAGVETTVWTEQELQDFADQQGVMLSLTTLGPGYRAVARAKHNSSQILGYVEGFVRPTGNLLHLDKMEVFSKMVKLARTENPDEFKGGGTILGVGLLLGYLCLLHGQEHNCQQAEFLAIDDEDFQHKRLVRLYTTAGFDFIKYVGDDLASIPDRLVWGGCGTLLRKDIPYLLQFWTRLMRRSQDRPS